MTSLPLQFVREVYKGKTLGRILMNFAIQRHALNLKGKVLDLAGGRFPSYLKYLPQNIERVAADLTSLVPVNMNERLPFGDGEFDNTLFFNAIYIPRHPVAVAKEIMRVTKTGGNVYVSAPFIQSEMPEPNDYRRFTQEGLVNLFEEAGARKVEVERLGGKFSSAANLLHDFWLFGTLRVVVYAVAIGLDKLTSRFQSRHPAPISYFISIKC